MCNDESLILDRNGSGVVEIDGCGSTVAMKFEVPRDRTVLSVFGAGNNILDGDKIIPPWIHHADGTRSKLYTTINEHRVSETRFYDLKSSEETYYKIVNACNNVLKVWQRAVKGLKKGKRVYFDGYGGLCYWYRSDYDGIGFEHVEEGEKHRITKFGTEIYHADRRHMRLVDMKGLAWRVFIRALRECHPGLWKEKKNSLIRMRINGRSYFLKRVVTDIGEVVSLVEILIYGDGQEYMEMEL